MLGCIAIVQPEPILALIEAPVCGDFGDLCRARANHPGAGTTSDAADKLEISREDFGWWGGRLGLERAVIRFEKPFLKIVSSPYNKLIHLVIVISTPGATGPGFTPAGRRRCHCRAHCCPRRKSVDRLTTYSLHP